MNNKDFITELATRSNVSVKDAQKMVEAFTIALADSMEVGDSLTLQGFGSFEIKKKLERIVVNPATKQRQLVPPKLAISFKPGTSLKDKTK